MASDFDGIIEKLKASDYWDMSRDQLLERFKGERFLLWSEQYFNLLGDLLQRVLVSSAHLDHVKEHPYECLVYSQTKRFKRYALALWRLIIKDGYSFMVCNDGAFTVLKALFELTIEARMVAAYLNTFGDTLERRRELTQRVLDFTDVYKKKANFKFKFIEIPLPDEVKSEGLLKEEAKTKEECEALINAAVGRLGEANARDVKHWFPTKGPDGRPIIKESRARKADFGSVRWRCEDVLARLSAKEEERRLWSNAYVSFYEVLNTYSHPVLGYDDCLRGENERLLDYFMLNVGIITPMHKWILPSVLRDLQADESILACKKTIDVLYGRMLTLCTVYSICVQRKDRAGFQA